MKKFNEKSEISLHLVKVFKAIKDADGKWVTNKEVSAMIKMPLRTVASHTLHLSDAGMINQAEVFPAHKFQFSGKADKRNKAFYERVIRAMEIFIECGDLK